MDLCTPNGWAALCYAAFWHSRRVPGFKGLLPHITSHARITSCSQAMPSDAPACCMLLCAVPQGMEAMVSMQQPVPMVWMAPPQALMMAPVPTAVAGETALGHGLCSGEASVLQGSQVCHPSAAAASLLETLDRNVPHSQQYLCDPTWLPSLEKPEPCQMGGFTSGGAGYPDKLAPPKAPVVVPPPKWATPLEAPVPIETESFTTWSVKRQEDEAEQRSTVGADRTDFLDANSESFQSSGVLRRRPRGAHQPHVGAPAWRPPAQRHIPTDVAMSVDAARGADPESTANELLAQLRAGAGKRRKAE